jgi:hypothetical protein
MSLLCFFVMEEHQCRARFTKEKKLCLLYLCKTFSLLDNASYEAFSRKSSLAEHNKPRLHNFANSQTLVRQALALKLQILTFLGEKWPGLGRRPRLLHSSIRNSNFRIKLNVNNSFLRLLPRRFHHHPVVLTTRAAATYPSAVSWDLQTQCCCCTECTRWIRRQRRRKRGAPAGKQMKTVKITTTKTRRHGHGRRERYDHHHHGWPVLQRNQIGYGLWPLIAKNIRMDLLNRRNTDQQSSWTILLVWDANLLAILQISSFVLLFTRILEWIGCLQRTLPHFRASSSVQCSGFWI